MASLIEEEGAMRALSSVWRSVAWCKVVVVGVVALFGSASVAGAAGPNRPSTEAGASVGAIDDEELRFQISLLFDEVVDREDKLRALDVIAGAGLQALPLLIERHASREDAVFLDDTPVDDGPLVPGGSKALRTTGRFMCELLLYRIVLPPPPSPSVGGRAPGATGLDAVRPTGGVSFHPKRTRLAFVTDWPAFWADEQRAATKDKAPLTLARVQADAVREEERQWQAFALEGSSAPPSTSKAPPPQQPVSHEPASVPLSQSGMLAVLERHNDPSVVKARAEYARLKGLVRSKPREAASTLRTVKDPLLARHAQRWLRSLPQ